MKKWPTWSGNCGRLRKTEETADDEVRAAKESLDAAEHAVIAARDELVRARAAVGPST